MFFFFFFLWRVIKLFSKGVWLRLKETEIVNDALSLGIYDPTYNLSYLILFDGFTGGAEHWRHKMHLKSLPQLQVVELVDPFYCLF